MTGMVEGKVALVTGAASGIGAESARLFAAEGARGVLVVDRDGDGAEAVAASIRSSGGDALAHVADVTDEAAVEAMVAVVVQRWGRIDCAHNNAGISDQRTSITELSLEGWQRMISINLTSVFLCVREFFRGIRRHGLQDPAAVLMGSTAGMLGEAGHADYAAAKAGLTYGLARSLKNEICRLAPRGRVNVVCPGWTFTPLTQRLAQDPPRLQRVLQTVPLRKVARAHDVAMAVVYLASGHLSGHVSGQILTVSGGMEGRVLYSPDEIDPNRA